MAETAPFAHPYIPNAAPAMRQAMLEVIGVDDVEELYAAIPGELRVREALDLPPAFRSEHELRRHMHGLLARNTTAADVLSFLGSGCYQHVVPAVCSEINSRAEFLTAYAGEAYEDHGKWQAIFEYTSLMAEVLEMDVVNVPTYDGYQATATALRMAVRMTGRRTVLISEAVTAPKRAKIDAYLDAVADVVTVPVDPRTGRTLRQGVLDRLDDTVAAVYVETPNLFGTVETELDLLAEAIHAAGGLLVCGVDPISLGFLPSPASAGADILCGDIQSLGLGMHFGGAHGGFIATHDEEHFVYEFPSRLFGLTPTAREGELGFADIAYERTSLAMREGGVEWVGTAAALWGITAGVYLALMGPHGMRELGETIAAHTRYAIERLGRVDGVEVLFADSAHWREFTVRYPDRAAADVHDALREHGIFGGAVLPQSVAGLGELTVFAVTEIHDVAAIDHLAHALERVLA